jgi:hypothetical protein
LSLRFSNLQAFVVCLFISDYRENNSSGSRPQSFTPEALMIRHIASWQGLETLERSLVKFIRILHATGPGSLKFVRFVDQSPGASNSFAHAGPLVRLPPFEKPEKKDDPGSTSASDAATEDPAGEDLTVGEQVLEQAYRYHHDTTLHP